MTRLRRHAPGLILHDRDNLQLADGVAVDVVEFQGLARQVLSGDARAAAAASAYQATLSGAELLPGWYDDWVIAERERVHQLRLHALEALARQLVERGAYAQALEAALTAVGMDPLRESAQRALLEVHLAEGNTAEAVRQYDRFRSILRDELDVAPTRHMTALIARATAGARSEHDRGGRTRRQPAWPPRDEAQARRPPAPSALRSGAGTSSS
ncbi:MAG: AfsR/SARP family transcriptional regulator [Actinomycetota bacterium]